MATLNRYRVIWTGGPGGTGISTFYSLPAATSALADIRAFFDGVKSLFPSTISWAFPNSGDQLESTDGILAGGWTQASAASVSGTIASGAFAAGVGLRVRWDTNNILAGRRLRGATFLTSIGTNAFQNDGTITSAALGTVQTAADAFVASNTPVIWSRPSPGGTDGGFGTAEAAFIPDRVTALRSRRY